MKKQLALVVVGLVAVLVVCGQLAHALAGPEPNDIQDSLPAWASDGVHVAFERTAPNLQHVVEMTSAGKDTSAVTFTGTLRGFVPRGGEYKLIETGGNTIVTEGGRYAQPRLELQGVDATASPDGERIAYIRGGVLYVLEIAGASERAVATGVVPPSWDIVGPVWSPDGTRIAVASGSSLLLVQADGSGSRVLFGGANQSVNPSWSPDGRTIVFERNAALHWSIWSVRADGAGGAQELSAGAYNDRYPVYSPVSNEVAFISDRQHLKGGATQYQFALYLRDTQNVVHKLVDDVHPYSPPRWSPTAALIAVSAGQECRRWGIYIVRSNAGARARRRSNLCRFDGTPGIDTIHGSPYFDRINGLGGNDRLYGDLGNDAIYGENGNDLIIGDAGNDFILGGPGDDRISGGFGNDVIIGGNGRDRIDCGPGNDTVEGAGPLDRIAGNCEHVRH